MSSAVARGKLLRKTTAVLRLPFSLAFDRILIYSVFHVIQSALDAVSVGMWEMQARCVWNTTLSYVIFTCALGVRLVHMHEPCGQSISLAKWWLRQSALIWVKHVPNYTLSAHAIFDEVNLSVNWHFHFFFVLRSVLVPITRTKWTERFVKNCRNEKKSGYRKCLWGKHIPWHRHQAINRRLPAIQTFCWRKFSNLNLKNPNRIELFGTCPVQYHANCENAR